MTSDPTWGELLYGVEEKAATSYCIHNLVAAFVLLLCLYYFEGFAKVVDDVACNHGFFRKRACCDIAC